MSSETFFQEQKPPQTLANVEKIMESNNMMVKGRNQLASLVEVPLLSACQELYDKNIMTLSSSANKGNPRVWIRIDFDSLSQKNKIIAESLGNVFLNVETDRNAVDIVINTTLNETIENIQAKALDVAHKFEKQPLVWARTYTLGSLREFYGYDSSDEELGIKDFANGEPDSYFYDPESKLFYESEELYKKATGKL